MYDYREYLTLQEAADMLSTDVRALLEQNSKEENKYGLPRIGFESDQFGTLYRSDTFNILMSEYSQKDYDTEDFGAFLYGFKYNKATIDSEGHFYYLSSKTVNNIRRNKFVEVGGYTEELEFTKKWQSYLDNSILIEIPDTNNNNDYYYGFHRNKRLVEMFDSITPRYICPKKKTLTIDDLLIRRSDVEKKLIQQQSLEDKLFYADAEIRRLESILKAERASRNQLDEDAKIKLIEQLRIDLDEANNEASTLKDVIKLKDEKMSKTFELFDEKMQATLKPVIDVIIKFGSSDLYQVYPLNKSYVTLGKIKDWVISNYPAYKDDRRAELIKDMINFYYQIK